MTTTLIANQPTRVSRPSIYADRIREILALSGFIGTDPRHVEAFMRLELSTLDGLTVGQFTAEVKLATECVLLSGEDAAEQVAQSFGL